MKLNKKYILFDNDGVLVHTEPLYFKANKQALANLNIELSFEKYLELMNFGGTIWDLAKKSGINNLLINEQLYKRNSYYKELLRTENIKILNVKKVLSTLSKKYKMAIVTTSKRSDFEIIHKDNELTAFMDFTLCLNEYQRVKPSADPYLEAMKKFNAIKEECIIIEDSYKGLKSALNAEIDCVIVYNEFTKMQDFSNASFKINEINELLDLL